MRYDENDNALLIFEGATDEDMIGQYQIIVRLEDEEDKLVEYPMKFSILEPVIPAIEGSIEDQLESIDLSAIEDSAALLGATFEWMQNYNFESNK